ncbi:MULTISPECIES: T7SS effector LXG polymorphic toxin [Bacillus]|uniref:T7SS effector LXG polymorphic toxin n=1 Tax=Bacillus TaxID=1386 RepID=UPI000D200971|nr:MULTISPECIES: T7SS effector LXG polymorphic toxin [Bacillus]AVI42712.1 transposase [Bacillus pumilus]MCP1150512.1 T7SS effector LXG polymorphic toxin [Bacillus sp. 1735sda2]
MKTLDAFALINGIDQTLNTLKQQSQQISSIEKQIQQIISLDGALKGEAGQGIRSFYTECHIPFLQFFQVVIEEYSTALKNTKQALHALESNQNGFISQAFIENELDQGLKKAERTISEIVSEVNHAIGRIGHIVHLPNVDESTFQQNYQKAWLNTSRTIGLLHAFDREQTSALQETKSSLQTMKQYINTLSAMFTGPKIDITSYQKGSIFKNGKEEKISSTINGLNDKIDNPKDNPMMIMLKKLREKERTNVETVVRETPFSKIKQTTLTLNGKVYNLNEYKKINFEHAKTVDVMRDGMLYRLRISEKNKVTIESVKPISEVKTGDQPQNILNTAVEFTGINDAIRVITGRDPITGDKVADMDRLVSGVYMVPSTNIVKVGKYVFKIIKGEKVAKRVEKTAKGIGKGEQLLDKVKTYEQARNKTVDIVGDLGPNSQPYTGTLKSSAGYGKVVGRQSADGKVRWRLDYDPKKGPHINIEDFRNGKGANARKIAIPFEGNENTFKSLLKHLNR